MEIQEYFQDYAEKIRVAPTLWAKYELVKEMDTQIPEGEEKKKLIERDNKFNATAQATAATKDKRTIAEAFREAVGTSPKGYPEEGKELFLRMARLVEIACEYEQLRALPAKLLGDAEEKKSKELEEEMERLLPLPEGNPEFKESLEEFVAGTGRAQKMMEKEDFRGLKKQARELIRMLEKMFGNIPKEFPSAGRIAWMERLRFEIKLAKELEKVASVARGLARIVDSLI